MNNDKSGMSSLGAYLRGRVTSFGGGISMGCAEYFAERVESLIHDKLDRTIEAALLMALEENRKTIRTNDLKAAMDVMEWPQESLDT